MVALASSVATGAVAAPGLALEQVTLEGSVTDVAVTGTGVVVSHVARGVRRLSRIDASGVVSAGPPVSPSTVAAGVCGNRIFLVDERGLIDSDGDVVVIARPPLLSVPDAEALPFVPVCPSPNERMLLVREGAVVVRVDPANLVEDEVALPFAHRARAYAGASARSLKGERPYAAALSLYAPWTFTFDADADGDLDLVLVHEERALVFRRTKEGLRGPAVERHLGDLIGAAAGSDIRAHPGGGGLVVTASAGALPEQTVVATVVGAAGRPLGQVARRDVIPGLAVFLGPPLLTKPSTRPSTRASVSCDAALDFDCGPPPTRTLPAPPAPLVARVDTSLVALSGVVLTGKVPFELRRGEQTLMTLPTVADVRAGRVDGALPVADVDLDGDGRVDIVDLGEPGRAVWWRGDGEGGATSTSSLTIPRLDRALGAPGLRRVVLIGRGGKKGTVVGLLRVETPHR